MRIAKVELSTTQVSLLAKGKPIVIKLPDAEVTITVCQEARLRMTLGSVADNLSDIIKKARGYA